MSGVFDVRASNSSKERRDAKAMQRESDARRFSNMAKLEKQLEVPRTSLAMDPSFDMALKIMFPIAWALNVCLYIWSNSLIGAAVHINVDINDQPGNATTDINPILPPVFEFSLMGSVEDMWTAGVYPLSILVFFMSGMWPQIKLWMMLWTWLAVPGKHISMSTRECVLKFLDAYGKWSLLDTYMMLSMMCAFHMDFNTAAMTALFMPLQVMHLNRLFSVDFAVQVIPDWGFYAFVIATVLSLIIGHVVSHAHRTQIDDCRHTHKRTGKKTLESVSDHEPTEIMHIECCPCLCFPVCVMPQGFMASVLVGLLIPIALFFLLLGLTVESISLTRGGLAGFALNTLSFGDTVSYSVWGMAQEVPNVVPEHEKGNVEFLQVLFLVFMAFAPILYLMLALVMWLVPMTVTGLQRTHMVAEIAFSWSTVDVYCLTMIATKMEIGQFVSFMTKAFHCDLIASALKSMPTVLAMAGGNPACLQVSAELDPGMYYLIISAVLSHAIAFFIDMSVVQTLKDRTGRTALEMQLAGLQLPDDSDPHGLSLSHAHLSLQQRLTASVRKSHLSASQQHQTPGRTYAELDLDSSIEGSQHPHANPEHPSFASESDLGSAPTPVMANASEATTNPVTESTAAVTATTEVASV